MRKFVILCVLMACSKNTRNQTLLDSLASVRAADQAFRLYDSTHEQDLANQAKDKASGEASLTDWQAKRRVFDSTLESAYRTIALAALATDNPSLSAAESAVQLVLQELTQLGIKVP